MFLRVLPFLLIALPALADPVPFKESLTIEGRRYPVPMTVAMTALSDTQLALTFSGDLTAVQEDLPAILSQVFQDDCRTRTAVGVTEVTADGREVRLEGRLQLRRYVCLGGKRSGRLIGQTADVRVVLGGKIIDECLAMRVQSVDLRPHGLGGTVLDATGLTDRLTRDLEQKLDEALRKDDNCINVPEEFRAFDARITGGGFRDIGDGRLGAQIHGLMNIDAKNFIGLVHLLGRKGRLGE